MNQKIIIMSPQDVSDEEIKKYMNFDQLLQTRNAVVKRQKLLTNSSIASILIVGALSIWYFFQRVWKYYPFIRHKTLSVAER